jgi:hypothetical protein
MIAPARSSGVVLIGSGPSLNRIDPRRLRDIGTIAFNRSFLAWPAWEFAPTYHACLDPKSIAIIGSDLLPVIRQYPRTHFFLHADAAKARIEPSDHVTLADVSPDAAFAASWHRLADLGNVGAISLQILALLGHRRVLMVGVDGVYGADNDDDPNHFRPDYARGRVPLTDAERTRCTAGWPVAARECRRLGLDVRNASEGTALTCFATIGFSAGLEWLATGAENHRMCVS